MYLNRRLPIYILLLLAAIIFEVVRRLTGYPKFGDVRGSVIAAIGSAAGAAAILLIVGLVVHWWPTS